MYQGMLRDISIRYELKTVGMLLAALAFIQWKMAAQKIHVRWGAQI